MHRLTRGGFPLTGCDNNILHCYSVCKVGVVRPSKAVYAFRTSVYYNAGDRKLYVEPSSWIRPRENDKSEATPDSIPSTNFIFRLGAYTRWKIISNV